MDSVTLLADWNKLENETNDILLNRFTQFGREASPVIAAWEKQYRSFGTDLEKLMSDPVMERQKDIKNRLGGVYRVWRFTEVRLNNANYYFNQIIQSGLGERVMVNGMLHTMYQMRMDGLLSVDEIVLLEETIYALESLDNAADEFDFIINSIISDMKTAGEKYLSRIRLLLLAFFFSVLVVLIVSFLINKQLKTAYLNKKIYQENNKSSILKRICLESNEEELESFKAAASEYDISLSVDRPVLIILFQIDRYREFSHEYNIEEQREIAELLCRDFSRLLSHCNYVSEYFRYNDEFIVFLLNAESGDNLDLLKNNIQTWHNEEGGVKEKIKISITLSDLCFETADLDRDFEYLIQLSEYRYLIGEHAFITPGSWKQIPSESFRYPLEKERIFVEAFKSLDKETTLNLISEMINYAEPYEPESVKRLILRLAAAQSAVVEILEKSFHFSTSESVTPMILEIQKKETLKEAEDMLEGIVERVIDACRNKKAEKHDQTVVMIKEIIKDELGNLNLSADEIASRFNLTTSYINRLFKQHTTLSIAGYINEVRLKKAEELLRTSGLSVSQVAEKAGFTSMGTFFRLFKKRYGKTPGEMLSGIS